MTENKSEVARLMARISEEYEAAQRGLNGLAEGVAKHEFITVRMENIGRIGGELKELVGEHEGARLLIIALEIEPPERRNTL